jgi:hypothetical protein
MSSSSCLRRRLMLNRLSECAASDVAERYA